MKDPEALRHIADQRHAEILTQQRKEQAAKERARNQRRTRFFNKYRQEWLDRCEQAAESAAGYGKKKTDVRFEPGVLAEGFEERKEFTRALVKEISDELRKQGFRTFSEVYHLPGDHEGPEIYIVTLTIDWSKSL